MPSIVCPLLKTGYTLGPRVLYLNSSLGPRHFCFRWQPTPLASSPTRRVACWFPGHSRVSALAVHMLGVGFHLLLDEVLPLFIVLRLPVVLSKRFLVGPESLVLHIEDRLEGLHEVGHRFVAQAVFWF